MMCCTLFHCHSDVNSLVCQHLLFNCPSRRIERTLTAVAVHQRLEFHCSIASRALCHKFLSLSAGREVDFILCVGRCGIWRFTRGVSHCSFHVHPVKKGASQNKRRLCSHFWLQHVPAFPCPTGFSPCRFFLWQMPAPSCPGSDLGESSQISKRCSSSSRNPWSSPSWCIRPPFLDTRTPICIDGCR